MKSKKIVLLVLLVAVSACTPPPSKNRAVYLLLDTSGTYTRELEKARTIMNYLLATLDSGDSVAMARIDSNSFTEKNIIAKATFDDRPSASNGQKRGFKRKLDEFIDGVSKGSRHTDITGGILQAIEYLNETGAGEKYILIFSDLEEDLMKGHVRDFAIDMTDIHVVALNVTKLRSDNIDPRDYLHRLEAWQRKVNEGGGQWRVVNDLERLESLFSER